MQSVSTPLGSSRATPLIDRDLGPRTRAATCSRSTSWARIAHAAWSIGVRPARHSAMVGERSCGAGELDDGLNLNSLFVVHIDVIGKIPDDALDGLAYFRLPEPIHDAAHHVYLGHG